MKMILIKVYKIFSGQNNEAPYSKIEGLFVPKDFI